jgi:transcription elongation factor GreA
MTTSQREALAAELAELEGPRRKQVVEAIATARGHGDLSENFEYHAAKNEQGLLEARIRKLRHRLDHATVVDDDHAADGVVAVGSRVEVEDETGERMQVELSAVAGSGSVSPESPLGKAILGRTIGDEVDVEAPRGAWRARIISVERG